MNDVRVLELNFSPKFALMKQVLHNEIFTQSAMSSSSNNISTKVLDFELGIFSRDHQI